MDNPHIYWAVDPKDEVARFTLVHRGFLRYLRRSGVTRQSMEALMGTTITVHSRFAKIVQKLMGDGFHAAGWPGHSG
jgi:hypothetical protein